MTRRPDAANFPAEVQAIKGDLEDASGLEASLEGVDTIFLMGPSANLEVYSKNLCSAAQQSGVTRVVLLSSLAVTMTQDNPLRTEHLRAEEAVLDSGLPCTFLRPGAFMSLALSWASGIRTNGIATALFGNQQAAPIDTLDIAGVAATVLLEEGHEGQCYALTGRERLRPSDQASILGEVLGRAVIFEEASEKDSVRRLAGVYHDIETVEQIVLALRASDQPWRDPLPTCRELTGREPRTFREWAIRNKHEFQ
jgi:uncharacterized protein YbjT (DUF2867 family)